MCNKCFVDNEKLKKVHEWMKENLGIKDESYEDGESGGNGEQEI